MNLDELEWDMFKQAVEVKSLTPEKLFIDSYRLATERGIMELYYHDETFYIVVSDEVKKAYAELQL